MAEILKSDAIQWHEGMLLLPQHFQQSDLRQRELLNFHISQVSPFHWGLTHAKIDKSLLVSGLLHYKEIEAVMPDGLIVSIYDSDEEFLEIDLSLYKKMIEQDPTMVYLAVPKYRYGAANAGNDEACFIPHKGNDVVDENSGQGAIEIPRLVPNAKLVIGEAPTSMYSSFPLCQIKIESNAYVLGNYIPPMLKVKSEAGLADTCNGISKQIREKIAYISQKITSRSLISGSGELEHIAQALTIGLLPFEAMLKSGATHPYTVYISLCTLAGQVAALNPGQIPPILEPYDHNNLKESFDSIFKYISEMIMRVNEGFTVVPFHQEDRTFSLLMREGWLGKKILIGLMSQQHMSQGEIVKWANECVIAGEDYVQTAMDSRVLGAKRTIIEKDEEMNLIPPTGAILIAVEVDPKIIQEGKKLKLFNVSDSPNFRPKEVVIYLPK